MVNRADSPYGAGWRIAGLARLHAQSDGSLVAAEGDGSAGFFLLTGCSADQCSYQAPPGDFATLTRQVQRDATGAVLSETFQRTLLDGTLLQYTAEGRLREVRDRFSNSVWYDYDAAGRLVAVTDPAGQRMRLDYDSAGRLAALHDPASRTVRVRIDTAGDLAQITEPDGLPALRLHYEAHRLSAYWDRAGSGYALRYDHTGHLARHVMPAFTTADGETVRPTTTFLSWEAALLPAPDVGGFLVPAARVEPGAARARITDSRGNTTTLALDRWGAPARVEDAEGGVHTLTRNTQGQVEQVTTPAGGAVRYTWSGPDLTRATNLASGTTTDYGYSGAFHQVDRVWVEDQLLVRHFLNARGLPDSTVVGTDTTRYQFDARGRPLQAVDSERHTTTWSYADAGLQNTTRVTQWRNGEARTTHYAYDAHGRTESVTDPDNATVTTAYDLLNRVVQQSGPEQLTLTYGYDDPQRTYTVTDPLGQRYTTVANALGWTERQTDPRGQSERFAYDRRGNLAEYTNRRNQQITYSYDALDRVRSETAAGQTTTWSYDPQRRWVVVSNAESTDTLFRDAAGQLLRAASRRGGVADSLVYGYTYAGQRNQLRVFSPATLTVPPGGNAPGLEYGYDEVLRLNRLWDFSNRGTEIGYNSEALPDTVTLPTNSTPRLRQHFAYTPLHAVEQIGYTRPGVQSALGRQYGYDTLERIRTAARETGPDEQEVRTLAYDLRGWLVGYHDVHHWTEVIPGPTVCPDPNDVTTCYQDDQVVEHADTLRKATYTYDAAGNRTDQGAVLETGNRLVQFRGYMLEYDAEGNLVRKSRSDASGALLFEQVLQWNALGQLVSVSTNGSTTTLGYDGLGRRVRKSTGSGTTRYLWDGDDLVLEQEESGAVLRRYGYYPGIDQPHSVTTGGATYYYGRELPNHVAGLVNQDNQVVNRYGYTPWGEVLEASEQVAQPLDYTARERDAETGLLYLRNRYYDPELARFISQDPIGLAGGINPYVYAANDPVNHTDPLGLDEHCTARGADESLEEYTNRCPIELEGMD